MKVGGVRTPQRDACNQQGQDQRPWTLPAKVELHLQKHRQAQGTRGCQVHREDLEHLQDHEHLWGQPHPEKRVRK